MLLILLVVLVLAALILYVSTATIMSTSVEQVWHDNIETLTKNNTDWRQVIHTSPYLQIVLMAPPTGEELGWEVHSHNDQFFRFEAGRGRLQIRDPDTQQQKTISVKDGDAAIVPNGTYHNVISDDSLKFYTIYGPPHHPPGTIDYTHADELKRNG